jgi:hypothetical protein
MTQILGSLSGSGFRRSHKLDRYRHYLRGNRGSGSRYLSESFTSKIEVLEGEGRIGVFVEASK